MARGLPPEVLILARTFHPVEMDAHHLALAIADFKRVSVQHPDHLPMPRLRADADKNKERSHPARSEKPEPDPAAHRRKHTQAAFFVNDHFHHRHMMPDATVVNT